MDRCHIELNYPQSFSMTVRNLKKLFDLMCRQHWRNTEAITKTAECLDVHVKEAQAEAVRAEIDYRDGYVSTKFKFDLTEADKKRIERENKRLYNNMLSKKKALDRAVKLHNSFIEIKGKYEI